MISRPAMPIVCLELKSENFKVATWHYRYRHHPKNLDLTIFAMFIIILEPNLKFQFHKNPIWPLNTASGDLENRKWNRVTAVEVVPRLPDNPVTPTADMRSWKSYSLRSSSVIHYLERRWRYSHLLTRYCAYNLLPEPTYPKHEYRGQLWGHPVAP